MDLNQQGGPTNPIHITDNSWAEKTKRLEDNIRDSVPFEGKFQGYIDGNKLVLPEELHHLFVGGGVVTFSTERHLLIFGNRHWERYQRLLSKDVGLSPVNNQVARHIYSSMHRFNKLNEDGSIILPTELLKYANLTDEVAIIGMIYHAELHDKKAYLIGETPEERDKLLSKFLDYNNDI